MSRSLVDDAFAHHVWATVRLIDAGLSLTPEHLDAAVPGTKARRHPQRTEIHLTRCPSCVKPSPGSSGRWGPHKSPS